ncbi:molybdate ABC transporter substrate-binding protein [Nocardioides sp. GY 10127]|nr:molybdate ABC transporter substrate-binding protein [Nocardioides sp. GY 10127]
MPSTARTARTARTAARLRRVAGAACLALALTGLAACSSGSSSTDASGSTDSSTDSSSGQVDLTILAAASLTESFTTLADDFEKAHPDVHVTLSFDSSATLASQALDGAPADLLATADTTTMDSATDALDDAPEIFASNTLTMVVPADNPAGITDFADAVDGDATYVACVETAPCGSLWAAISKEEGVTSQPASLEVDVKSVLQKVTSDEADAGFVYVTDAAAAGDAVQTFTVPGAEDHVTSYPIAPLTQSEHPTLARKFIELVMSAEGQKVLADAGFSAPQG